MERRRSERAVFLADHAKQPRQENKEEVDTVNLRLQIGQAKGLPDQQGHEDALAAQRQVPA